jgi:serine/threonine protein kinase
VYRKLDNENIVKYIGSEVVNNQFCIYLEYLSGGSLCSIYQSYGKLSEPTIKVYTK